MARALDRQLTHETSSTSRGHMPHTTPDTTTLRVEFAADEIAVMTRGLVQRALLTAHVLDDLSGPQRLIARGLIPPEVLAITHGCPLPFQLPPSPLTTVAMDIVRNADGQWTTVADRTAQPAGLGLLTRLGGRPESLETLRELASSARTAVVVDPDYAPPHERLTPDLLGQDARIIADALDLPVLSPGQITVHDWRLRGPDGGDLDLLVTYLPLTHLDPLEPTATSTGGIRGLAAVLRHGSARLHSLPAAALFASPALATFLPRLSREVLGEELLLRPVTSFWCGDRLQCSHVISRIGRLRVRSLATPDTYDGRSMTIPEQADLCARIADEPWNWIAHEPVEPAYLSLPSGISSAYTVRAWASVRDGEWHADTTALGLLEQPEGGVQLAHLVKAEAE